MARPEWRDPDKERFWRRAVRDWRRSGLTARDFCAERGLAEHNFFAWRRTLAQRDQEQAAQARPAAATPRPQPKAHRSAAGRSGARFVPVRVVADQAAASAAVIEIVLPRGVVVRVLAGVADATLRQLLRALSLPGAEDASC
jgi:hypothetical protein